MSAVDGDTAQQLCQPQGDSSTLRVSPLPRNSASKSNPCCEHEGKEQPPSEMRSDNKCPRVLMCWDTWGQKPGQKDTSPCEALERSSAAGSCLQPGQCPWNALLPVKILSAPSCLQPFASWPEPNPGQRHTKSNKYRLCPQCGVCAGFIGPFHPWGWIFPLGRSEMETPHPVRLAGRV